MCFLGYNFLDIANLLLTSDKLIIWVLASSSHNQHLIEWISYWKLIQDTTILFFFNIKMNRLILFSDKLRWLSPLLSLLGDFILGAFSLLMNLILIQMIYEYIFEISELFHFFKIFLHENINKVIPGEIIDKLPLHIIECLIFFPDILVNIFLFDLYEFLLEIRQNILDLHRDLVLLAFVIADCGKGIIFNKIFIDWG
jgi:hypothetical protein